MTEILAQILAHTYFCDVFRNTWELHWLPLHIIGGYVTAPRRWGVQISKDKRESYLATAAEQGQEIGCDRHWIPAKAF